MVKSPTVRSMVWMKGDDWQCYAPARTKTARQ